MTTISETNITKHIKIISFDFDGCLFNSFYRDKLYKLLKNRKMANPSKIELKNPFFEANKILFTGIAKELENQNYDEIFYLIGSNRQSFGIDEFAARNVLMPDGEF